MDNQIQKQMKKELLNEIYQNSSGRIQTLLEKEYPELVKQKDGWYKSTNGSDWFMFVEDGNLIYGFDAIGLWKTKTRHISNCENYQPATDQEALKRLTEHARKLGYKEGVTIESLFFGHSRMLDGAPNFMGSEFWMGQCCLMKDGKWAPIVSRM